MVILFSTFSLPKKPHAKRISLSFRLPKATEARKILPLVEALIACLDGLPQDCHVSTVVCQESIQKAHHCYPVLGFTRNFIWIKPTIQRAFMVTNNTFI